jgi:hypothetical protein
MRGKEQERRRRIEETMKMSIVFESISRSSLLVKLTLRNVILEIVLWGGAFCHALERCWTSRTIRAIRRCHTGLRKLLEADPIV